MAHVSKSSDRDKLVKRVDRIRASGGDPVFVAVYCNTCERIEAASDIDELMPKLKGWLLDDAPSGQDYCPECRTDPGWAGSFPKPR